MTDVVLSKIASISNKNIENIAQTNYNRIIFCYKQKTWELLDAFESNADILLDIIKICEGGELKSVALVESADGKYLLAQYSNNVDGRWDHQCAKEIVGNLFSIIYPVTNKSKFVQKDTGTSSGEHHVLKKYVTTKLFEALQRKHSSTEYWKDGDTKLKLPAKFQPKLCKYQEHSVQWLLMKETSQITAPDFFETLKAKDDETTVYRHLYTHFVQDEPQPHVVLPPGGILAEEMGLGKTVEILALILLNPRMEGDLNAAPCLLPKRRCLEIDVFCVCTSKSKKKVIQCSKCFFWQHLHCVAKYNTDHDDEVNSPYLCPNCWRDVIQEYGLVKSNSTLIVSPNTIKLQWLNEIRRHIQPSLKVLLYDGMNAGKWISPSQIAAYDVVLTDYNVLRGEVHFTSENISGRTTRNKPQSIRKSTPLQMIEWWRVCLDEAQMVESNTSKMAALVRMIPAINRWAVTGTPIQRSLDDLQPLLKFVGFDTAADVRTWNSLVNDFLLNHESSPEQGKLELVNVLEHCMWRTCKSQIADELQIPPQQEMVHRIEFDNMEKLFYNELHAECKTMFQDYVHKYTRGMKAISPQIMKIILQPFLKIRQSCTMPVVVTNSHSNNPSMPQHKQFLQPHELHDYLKSTNELSCKSELRSMASSHNGLAALYILQEKYEEAIKHYEAVIKLSKEYNDMNITVDSLLQIHALSNLIHVKIIQRGNSVPDTPRNALLRMYEEQWNSLEWKYLSTYSTTLNTVMTSYKTTLNKTNADVGEYLITSTSEAFDNLQETDNYTLLEKIIDECTPKFGGINAKLAEIRSLHALLYVIDLWFSRVKRTLDEISSEFNALQYFSENVKSRNEVSTCIWRNIMELVQSVYDCHLREIRENKKEKKSKQEENKKTKCKMCDIREAINRLECLLFDKVIDKNSNFTEGLEHPSFEMYLCKLTFTYVKSKHLQNELSVAMENNWMYLENMQAICKRLIKLWIEMEYTIKAYDELNMCKMRISITDDVEDKSINKILKHEISQRIVDQQNDLLTAQTEFNKKLARLKYIRHLKSNQEIGPCPICRLTEEPRYAVLECGHHICIQCLQTIRTYDRKSTFKCSVCRNIQQNQNIYYMSCTSMHVKEGDSIQGAYSSKITYIVRLILKLQKEDKLVLQSANGNHNLKVLIFSEWNPILTAISCALKENGITFRIQCTPKTLEEFKSPQLGVTCLLMPFVKGSKGLNLVEATHVFLVEPILNPGEELQAIGRVHRFGQTRSTTVHRFIMMGSIEENIFNFISASSSKNKQSANGLDRKWEFDNISLDDFNNLFALKATNLCE